ncbi:hypothetical protein KCU90_g3159, partial [Aureobasidium melanogenum]
MRSTQQLGRPFPDVPRQPGFDPPEAQLAVHLRPDLAVQRQEHQIRQREAVQGGHECDGNPLAELRRFEHVAGDLNQAEHRPQNAERRRVAARLLPDARGRHVVALIGVQLPLQRVFEYGSRHAVGQKLQTAFGERIEAAGLAHLERLEHKHAVQLRLIAPLEQDREAVPVNLARLHKGEPQLLDAVVKPGPGVLDHHRAERAAEDDNERLRLKQRSEMPTLERKAGHDGRYAKQGAK